MPFTFPPLQENQGSGGRVPSADEALMLGSEMGEIQIFLKYVFHESCNPKEKTLGTHHNHHVFLIFEGDEENFLNL